MNTSGGSTHKLGLQRWPIPRLVWPFVVLVVLTGWVATYLYVRSEHEAAAMAAVKRAQDRTTLLEQHVIKTLQVASLASLHLGHLYLPGRNHEAIGPVTRLSIDEPTVATAGLSGVAIWDPEGRTLAASGPGASLTERDRRGLLAVLRRGPELAVLGPYALDEASRKSVLVTRRIVRDGGIAGYVALFFQPDQFLNFPLRTDFAATDLVSVIRLDGVTLARREGDVFSSGQNVAGGLVMRKQLADPNGTYLGPSSLDGHVRYFSHRRLEAFPIFVTAGVSHSAALASAQLRAAFYYGILGILSALGFLMAWLVQREVAYRERQASALADSAQRLQEAQRIGKIGDWEYDPATGIVIWSDALCEMYERPLTEDHLTFEDFADYLVPEDRARIEADFHALLATGSARTSEFKIVLPSGRTAHHSVHSLADLDEDGRVICLFGTDQDVTQEHLVRELEMQVAHLDRQGAMSMMAGTLAHELNQPLTAASNYITGALRQTARLGESAAASVSDAMRYALGQIHDAGEIIRRARKLVQVEADRSRTAAARETIADAISLLTASGLEGAGAIRAECEPGLPDAQISRVQLQQVLVNLLKNALEAAPAEAPAVAIRAGRGEDAQLRIEVSDNGPGFPATPIDAFSSFYTEKLSGLGLGLSISRTIIEYHGGKLWIEKSQPGDTMIALTLPFVDSRGVGEAGGERA